MFCAAVGPAEEDEDDDDWEVGVGIVGMLRPS